MGFITNVGNAIRAAYQKDPDQISKTLAKGATSSGALTGSGRDMLQVFGYDAVASYLNIESDLLGRYTDYEEMDEMAEVSSSIDIFADDCTQPDATNRRSVWIVSKDRTIETILDRDLFQRTLRIDEEIWDLTRTLVKYGNDMEEILISNDGVVGFNFLPPATVRRIEGPRGEHYGFVQDFRGRYGYTPYDFRAMLQARTAGKQAPMEKNMPLGTSGFQRPDRRRVVAFEPWEVVHFRIRSRQRRSIYGSSALESARWIWKRLQLLEDAALIYRLQRAPERFAFYVDVGDLPPAEALAYVNRVKQAYKKKRFFDPSTGKLNMRWESLTPDDDFWVPVRQGKEGARIEVLGAPAWQCLVGETTIPLLDGTRPTIKELAERGGEFGVYSCTEDGRIVSGKGHSARISHENAEIWQVWLTNGEVVHCTGNHPFLTRDGKWVLAESLLDGTPLMPFERGETQTEVTSKEVSVLFVEKTNETEPVYDLIVDEYHCFAIGQGVFVHNSMEDIEYFRDKLFAAIKVPKSYLGQEKGVARQILSSEDVRFARTILRIQRELRNGLGKVCRIHMAAIGMDPLAAEYDVRMTVPSAIFDLAQMEVRNAKADLAARMNEFVSPYWILSRIFDMSDGEIEMIVKQREETVVRQAKLQAAIQDGAQDVALRGQIKRQSQMQKAGLLAVPGASPEGPTQPPAEATTEDAYNYYDNFVRQLSKGGSAEMPVWALRSLQGTGIRERELMSGDREAEKRAEDKLDKILQNDKHMNGQLQELRGFFKDLSMLSRGQ